MATQQRTIDFLTDQLAFAAQISTRKMFGEYAIYTGAKVVAFVCDDELFVKPTDAGRKYLGEVEEKPAYPGSKMYFWISGDKWDDAEWLSKLIMVTADDLPEPKPKKKKIKPAK